MEKKYLQFKNKKQDNKKIEKLVNFILEYRSLKYVLKSSICFLKGPITENIAEHSLSVIIISWILAKLENTDENKAIKMALIHDLAEVRSGERNLINKFYTQTPNELKLIKEISENYILDDFNLPKIFEEFLNENCKEAKIVRDADILSQMLWEKECFDLGNFKTKRWLNTSLKRLRTKYGKKLGKMLYEIDSDKWWLEIVQKYILKTKLLSLKNPFFHRP